MHALLGIETLDELFGHPVVGASWEGFVIETLLSVAPEFTQWPDQPDRQLQRNGP